MSTEKTTPLDTLKKTLTEVFGEVSKAIPMVSFEFDEKDPSAVEALGCVKVGGVSFNIKIKEETEKQRYKVSFLNSYAFYVAPEDIDKPYNWLIDQKVMKSSEEGRQFLAQNQEILDRQQGTKMTRFFNKVFGQNLVSPAIYEPTQWEKYDRANLITDLILDPILPMVRSQLQCNMASTLYPLRAYNG